MMLRLVHDNTILALDSETPLLIRSHIILQATIISLRVSLSIVATKETHFVHLRCTQTFSCAAFNQHEHPT